MARTKYTGLCEALEFDPNRKYPIINRLSRAAIGQGRPRAFTAARGEQQARAELGFIVSASTDGTPNRSKAFSYAYYGAMGRHNALPIRSRA